MTLLPVAYRVRVRNTAEGQRETWATYVSRLRTSVGMSRAEFGRRIGVDPTTVWRWETGKQKPESPDAPEAIAALFGLPVDEVLEAAGLKPSATPPVEPTRERDEELEMILTANIPASAKEELIVLLERERDEDRRRRMERTQQIIDLYRRRVG